MYFLLNYKEEEKDPLFPPDSSKWGYPCIQEPTSIRDLRKTCQEWKFWSLVGIQMQCPTSFLSKMRPHKKTGGKGRLIRDRQEPQLPQVAANVCG